MHACPPATQTWPLLAAADPTGDIGRLAGAAAGLGVTPDDADRPRRTA